MNAISKRLLSGLMVLVMVLSMVPALNLTNFAVETKADVIYGSEQLPDGVQATIDAQKVINDSDDAITGYVTQGICPMCGSDSVTWNQNTPLSNFRFGHYYYDQDVTDTDGKYLAYADGTKESKVLCIAATSTAKVTATNAIVSMSNSGSTVNIMGTGTLCGSIGLDINGTNNTLNLYGCKVQWKEDSLRKGTQFAILRTGNTINMYDGAVIGWDTAQTTTDRSWVRLYNGGTFNMYGGTICNGYSTNSAATGGNVSVEAGTFNMYGGTIEAGQAAGDARGGNVSVNGGIFNMYRGTIQNGDAAGHGGNVGLLKGTFNMYGGSIIGGTAATHGGNVFANGATSVMNIQGGTISGGEATYGGNIRIYNYNAEASGIGGTVWIDGGEAKHGGNIYVPASQTLKITDGKISGGDAGEYGGNIYNMGQLTVSGGIITDGNAPKTGGNIYNYVADDGKSGGTVTLSGTVQLTNGTATSWGGNIYNAYTLEIKGGTISGGTAQIGGSIYNNGTMTMTAGTITGGKATNESNGGGAVYNNSGKTFEMTGGSITGGTAVRGGAIYNKGTATVSGTAELTGGSDNKYGATINNEGTFHVNGGTITGGTATTWGGNIISEGKLNINGGTIIGGTAPIGGNIYNNNGTVTMTAGSIIGGTATNGSYGGGSFYNKESATFTMTGGSIAGGNATNGGAIYNVGTATVGGNITGGNATNGGAIYNGFGNSGTGELTVSGTVSGSSAQKGGAIYNAATATVSGTVSDSSAKQGGAIYNAATATVTGTVSGGSATEEGGGNIFNDTAGSLTVSGTVSDGFAKKYGGNIDNRGTLTMNDAIVENGVAENRGGNLFNYGGFASANITGGAITGGQAWMGGGNLDNNSSAMTVTGTTIADGWVGSDAEGYTFNAGSMYGGNIRATGTGTVTLKDCTVYGGVAGSDKTATPRDRNIAGNGAGNLIINGGTIVGDIKYDGTTTLIGNPLITNSYNLAGESISGAYGLSKGGTIVITDLGNAAEILISNFQDGNVIAESTNAADLAGCFQVDGEGLEVTANGNQLVVTAIVVASPVVYLRNKNEGENTAHPYTADQVAQLLVDYKTMEAAGKEPFIFPIAQNGGWGETVIELSLDGKDYTIDCYAATFVLSGVGTVKATNTSGGVLGGPGAIRIADGANINVATTAYHPQYKRTYVSVQVNKGRNEWNAFNVQANLTGISMRPSEAGWYYKAEYQFANQLNNAEGIVSYGVALNGNTDITEDYFEDNLGRYTECTDAVDADADKTGIQVSGTSGGLFGILKKTETGREADENAVALDARIYAKAYVMVDRYPSLDPDQDPDNRYYYVLSDDVVSHTLHEVLGEVNKKVAAGKLTADQVRGLKAMYNEWNDEDEMSVAGQQAWQMINAEIAKLIGG